MSQSKDHYKLVIEAAARSGVFKKQLKSKSQVSSQYFKDYIKPSNDRESAA